MAADFFQVFIVRQVTLEDEFFIELAAKIRIGPTQCVNVTRLSLGDLVTNGQLGTEFIIHLIWLFIGLVRQAIMAL